MCPTAFSELRALGLPNRAIRVLHRADIRTQEVLESKTRQELMDTPGIGLKSLKAIERALAQKRAWFRLFRGSIRYSYFRSF